MFKVVLLLTAWCVQSSILSEVSTSFVPGLLLLIIIRLKSINVLKYGQ